MSKTKLRNRIKALEEAAPSGARCTYGQHRDLLLEILQRRAVPLPRLDGMDLLSETTCAFNLNLTHGWTAIGAPS